MKHVMPLQSSYAMLFDPAVARAVAERAAQWDLPRHVCRPLDHYVGPRVSADLAAYDAVVESTIIPAEEMLEEPRSAGARETGSIEQDSDFADTDDL